MSKILGVEAAEVELRKLLEEGRQKIQQAGNEDRATAARRDLAQALVDFTNRTEPKDILDDEEFEAISRIDAHADETRREIRLAAIDKIVDRIEEQASKLNQLAKTLKHEAAKNETAAKSIRLQPIRDAITSVAATIDALNKAKTALLDSETDETEVAKKIDSLIRAFNGLKRSVLDLGQA
jgi:hypothetical protein